MAGLSRPRWFAQLVAARIRESPAAFRAIWTPALVFAGAIGACFLPINWSLGALRSPDAATTFIGQLWAVTGAAVGFSVAVVVFALQAVAASRRSVSFRELAALTPLLGVVYAGIAALLVDGCVLLGAGRRAPAGWPATWATLLSFAAVAALAPLFGASLRAIDQQQLHRKRIAEIRKVVHLATVRDAHLRLMFNLFRADSERHKYEFHPLGLPPNLTEVGAKAARDGYVVDIRLDRIRRVSLEATARSQAAPKVVTYPTAFASAGRLLVALDGSATTKQCRLAARIVATSRRPPRADDALVEAANRLHDEALEAILDDRPAVFDEARLAQQELLLALPTAWSRLGQVFDEGLASGILPLSIGPLDLIARQIYQQVERAISSGHRDVAIRAAGLPGAVAYSAVALNAPGLVSRMLSLLRSVCATTVRSQPETIARIVHESALDSLFSHIEYAVAPRVEDASQSEMRRDAAVRSLLDAHGVVADVMRSYVDAREWNLLLDAMKRWGRIMEFWLGDHEYDLDDGASNDGTLARQIVAHRGQLTFALASWLLRRLWTSDLASDSADAYLMLTGHLSGADAVISALGTAEEPVSDRTLSDWIMSDLPAGEVHVIDSNAWVIRTAVLQLLRLAGSTPQLSIPAHQWLLDRQEALETALKEIESRPQLCSGVGVVNVPAAAATLRAGLAAAQADQRNLNEEELIAAELDSARIEGFRTAAVESWAKGRLMMKLAEAAGAYEFVDAPPPTVMRLAHPPQLLPKDLFTSSRIYGLEGIGRQFGHGIARGENDIFWRIFRDAKPLRRASGTVDDRIRDGLTRMLDRGYKPTAIFVPFNWRLRMQMTFDDRVEQLEVERSRDVIGFVNGVPVVQAHELPKDRVVIADLGRLARATQWASTTTQADGQPAEPTLEIRVQDYDATEAIAAVKAQPALMREPGRTRQKDRAHALRTVVRVDVGEALEVQVMDRDAARAVLLPSELTQK